MELHEDPDLAGEHGAVRRELVLPLSREDAWPLLSDPRELETWLADEVDVDVSVGAEGNVRLAGGEERHAVVEEVDPGRRVTLRWRPIGGGEETIVELTLDDDPAGTRLAVLELPVRTLHAIGSSLTGAPAPASGPQLAALCI